VLRSNRPQWRQAITPVALAIVALVAAVALWVAVTESENPKVVHEFQAAIPIKTVNVADGLAVASLSQQAVQVRVSAPEDVFSRLSAANFSAQVDLTGVRDPKSSQIVLVEVIGEPDASIVDVSPTFVDVTLENETSKDVPVKVNRTGPLPQGFSVTATEANPATVRVTGATSLVQFVQSADIDVNVTGLRANLQRQGTLTARDASGADVPRVTLEPASAEVKLTVVPQETRIVLPVVVQPQGSVADGYNITSVTADPQTVEVSGQLDILQGLTSLTTEPIDVSGAKADLTRSLKLRVPANVTASRDSVSVTIKVAPAQGTKAVIVAPDLTDVPSDLQATLQTTALTIRVSGDVPTLNALTPGAVKATVSLAGKTEGVQTLTPQITVPQGVTLVSVQPQQVTVVLRK
jgi:YbbR domain-containing protein